MVGKPVTTGPIFPLQISLMKILNKAPSFQLLCPLLT